MARPQKNTSSPIFALRQTLGTTQPDFAQLIGVNYVTIQSIEGGRLKLTTNVLEKIRFGLGAQWDQKRNLWTDAVGEPYTWESLKAHCRPASKETIKRETAHAHAVLDSLVRLVPAIRWPEFMERLNAFSEKTAAAFDYDAPLLPAAPTPRKTLELVTVEIAKQVKRKAREARGTRKAAKPAQTALAMD